jgi:transketolase
VQLALAAFERLAEEDVAARVVSMPSWELFEAQDETYRNQVLPPEVTARVAVEAGVPMGWERYAGRKGKIVGLDHFGASAPGGLVLEKFGFTTDTVVAAAKEVMEKE